MRLRRLREVAGYPTQTAFARRLGISLTRWNNFEKRGLPLSREIEDKLCRLVPGLTLDWLRNGSRHGLSVDLDRRLHQPQKGPRGATSEAPGEP